jgi:hypothetical protein
VDCEVGEYHMTDLILSGVLLLSGATLAVVILVLRTSQRSERIGERRYDLLLNQRDMMEMLREERQMLSGEAQQRPHEQQGQEERLQETHSGSSEDPERKRALDNGNAQWSKRQRREQGHTEREYRELRDERERERRATLEAQQRIEQLEKAEDERLRIQQEKEQLAQKLQQLMRDLEREREERRKIQQQAEQSQQERVRLQTEYQLLRRELDGLEQSPTEHSAKQPKAYRPRWSRPVQLAAVLFGMLALWLSSLVVALNLLQS